MPPAFSWFVLLLLATVQTLPAELPLRADADLVLIPITVTNQDGTAVPGIVRSQLRLADDNQPRSIVSFDRDRSPQSLAFVVDTSASMGSKMDLTRMAIQKIADSTSPGDEVAMITFSSTARVRTGFTGDVQEVIRNLASERAAGETALIDAVWLGLRTVRAGHHSRKTLIVISDGGDNHSRHTASELLNNARETDARIYGIAIHDQTFSMSERFGSDLLHRLAQATGGLHNEIRTSSQLPEAAERIADAARNAYVIGFSPPDHCERARWHSIRVRPAESSNQRWRINARSAWFESERQ